MDTSRAHALALDQHDELAPYRQEFVNADPTLIYLDGNSLGRLPQRTRDHLHRVIEVEWGAALIRGWELNWLNAPTRIGGKIAQLLGANAEEVIVSDSTSVNFYKLVWAALTARPDRSTIVTDDLNFPSDLYVLQGLAQQLGRQVKVIPSRAGLTIAPAEIAAALGPDTALLTLSHVTFKSGYRYDMAHVTALAHQAGALMLWDVSHSVGAMPLDLSGCGVDLAVGCAYKYVNGGPGAPAFLYAQRGLHAQLRSPIWGWFGQQNQFEMTLDYAPRAGVAGFLVGTPPVLSLLAIEPGVDLLLEAGLPRLRAKAERQTEYLIQLWEAWLRPLGVSLNTPRETALRGAHVSLGHPEGLRIKRALIEDQRVLPDFRYPDNLRLGLAPIYTTYADIHEAMRRLRRVLAERLYEKYPVEKPEIT
jgi:kynureninase